MKGGRSPNTALSGVILVSAVFLFVLLNSAGKESRSLPERGPHGPVVRTVATQADAYRIYRDLHVRGALVIHLNQYFNLVDYHPPEFFQARSFPLALTGIDRGYEQGLNSHNWLAIAARMGMARSIISVLPDRIYRARIPDLEKDRDLVSRGDSYQGYDRDVPRQVVAFSSLPAVEEPVVVNLDAGFFDGELEPRTLAETLAERFRDIRLIVLIRSEDEPEVTVAMREKLALLEEQRGGLR